MGGGVERIHSLTALVLGDSVRHGSLQPLADLPKDARAYAIKAQEQQQSVRKARIPLA